MSGEPRGEPGGTARADLGRFGLRLFLVSLTMIFGATILGYAALRGRADVWRPEGAAAVPRGFWVSTATLVACSVVLKSAVSAVRRDRLAALRRCLVLAVLLGIAFLVLQAWNWSALLREGLGLRSGMFAFTLYLLTGLHAVHVLGGIAPLLAVAKRSFENRYSAANPRPVENVALYWHFLDAVWIVMLVVFLTG